MKIPLRKDGCGCWFAGRRTVQIACGAVLVGGVLGAGLASAQDEAPGIRVELNRLEAQGENCRVYLLVKNERLEALKSFKADLFAFDTGGVAQKRLAVELGPIPRRKTRVKLFDFPGVPCAAIGSVLLNDVLSCEGPAGARDDCLDRVETSSKQGSVALIK